MTKNFFHPSLLLLILDPGSGMGKNQDPGSGTNILDPQHCFKLQENILVSNNGRHGEERKRCERP